jgi:hypothetical protein
MAKHDEPSAVEEWRHKGETTQGIIIEQIIERYLESREKNETES